MKRKITVLVISAIAICMCAWLNRPDYFVSTGAALVASGISSDDLYDVENQAKIRSSIDALIEKNTYTETDPLLIYDAFSTNTLSMYAYFTTSQSAKISYTIHVEDEDISDFSQTLDSEYTTIHEYQLLGLIPDRENTITLHIRYEDGTENDYTTTYTVGSLKGSEDVKLEKTTGTSTQEVGDGLYVILGNDSTSEDFMYYYDNNGILRGEIPIEEYRSHRLLFDGDSMYFSYNTTKMAKMNNLGQITATYDLGNYELHHDYVFDDDGNILLLATDTTQNTVEDMIVRLNPDTGEVSLVCDMGDLFTTYKTAITAANADDDELDWTHLNTIQWMGNNEILVSSRETSTIVKISNLDTTPTIDYMMGEKTFWADTEYSDLLLEKANSFVSQSGQHSITYVEDDSLDDGQYYLYMFNNNFGFSSTNTSYDWTQVGCATSTKDTSASSNYYMYLVDENEGTYELVDSFDVPYSPYVSSVQNLSNTTVVDSGMDYSFQEYDSDHTLIQSFKMDSEKYIYRVYKYTFDGFYFNK